MLVTGLHGEGLAAPRVRAALLVIRNGRVLVAEHEKGERRYFLLPGGGVDPGEGWDRAAAREVREELGVEARTGALLAVFENRSPDGERHILHAIFAGEVEGEPAASGEDPRVVGCRFMTPAELDDVVFFPRLGRRLHAWVGGALPAGAEYALLDWED